MRMCTATTEVAMVVVFGRKMTDGPALESRLQNLHSRPLCSEFLTVKAAERHVRLTLQQVHPTAPETLPLRAGEAVCPHGRLHTDVQSSSARARRDVEAARRPHSGRADKQPTVCPDRATGLSATTSTI